MNRAFCILGIVFGLNTFVTLPVLAGPVAKQPLQPQQKQQLAVEESASKNEIAQVDAGILGAVNTLLSLAIGVGVAYLIYEATKKD